MKPPIEMRIVMPGQYGAPRTSRIWTATDRIAGSRQREPVVVAARLGV
jgi:hypothetical protein